MRTGPFPSLDQYSQSGPIVRQSEQEQLAIDEVTHRIHLAMGSIGHPGSTIQDSVQYRSVFFYYLVRPTTYEVLFKEVSVFDETRPFYLIVQVLRGVSICL